MPYKTIQQNFSNGELNPKMQGRSDVEMYYKSAQKMRDVATTPYGGFVRRPGFTKIADLTEYYKNSGNKNIRLIPFVFNNDQSYVLALTAGKIDVFYNDVLDSTIEAADFTEERLHKIKFAQSADTCFFVHPDFKPLKLIRGGNAPTYNNMYIKDEKSYISSLIENRIWTGTIDTNAPFTIQKDSDFEIVFSFVLPTPNPASTPSYVERRFITLKFIDDTGKNPFYFNIDDDLVSLSSNRSGLITSNLGTKETIIQQPYTTEGTSAQKKISFKIVYTNSSNKMQRYYKFDEGEWILWNEIEVPSKIYNISNINILQQINGVRGSDIYTDLSASTYVKVGDEVVWSFNAAQTTKWTLSFVGFESIPIYDFKNDEPIKGNTAITPDNLDGVVKLTLEGTLQGSPNLVGQYIEGNGGRVKITSQSGNTLTGYTVIGFYSTDKIPAQSWTYTQSYEPVWSETRGWPVSVTFHQGRLWFGGSKSRPQTVWGSKVGLFYKFDPTSGYDNDAIEFTLDTTELNKIVDIYSLRNLLIFTEGGEFVCQTSYNEPITPKNVNATKQTSNGSWALTSPIDLEGAVLFIERRGQAIMNFVYLGDEAYNSQNSSIVNSHLINRPEDLDVERNNLTQQTNYVYIVNNDGTLCVVNLLAAQGITGGFTLWKTKGIVKSVCVIPNATYIAVEREDKDGNKIYLEKLDWNILTDNTEKVYANNQSRFVFSRFANKVVDVLLEGEFVGQYTADDTGTIDLVQSVTGNVEIGLPFRSYVQSNYLELPNMGAGVGKRKRLASMTVRVIDTPELTINGETRKLEGVDIEDVNFYAVGDWSIKPTWEFTQSTPYKFNVLAMQMNVNYEVAND